ncbi:MAG: response regulator [Verrucomicrobiales bacterium]|nr:response regulator [Verrucomicrobiales bacterium]
MAAPRNILLVEDNEDDVFLLQRALKFAQIEHALQVARDGQEALDYLAGTGPYLDRERYPLPALVLLDLKLPKRSGFEILSWTRGVARMYGLIIVVFTSSNQPADIAEAYRQGANSYVIKPVNFDQLVEFAKVLMAYWLFHNCPECETVPA